MSTDCVFSGKTGPYTEKSPTDGVTFYDKSKALGEINKCLQENNDLSKDQIKKLISLKNKIAKCKLGDKDYEKFKELLKKSKKDCLNDDEKKELDGYLKKIYCK